jgi:uncharacterized protein (TIGR02284 family)
MFLMSNFKKIIEVLNDLIKINKEREEGYVKAGRELTPAERNLRGVFERKAQDSRNNVIQLQHKAEEIGAQVEDETATGAITGAIYRAWSELKNVFNGNDKESILKCCESDEEAAQKCYQHALEEQDLPEDLTHVIREQKQSIDASRDEIHGLLAD